MESPLDIAAKHIGQLYYKKKRKPGKRPSDAKVPDREVGEEGDSIVRFVRRESGPNAGRARWMRFYRGPDGEVHTAPAKKPENVKADAEDHPMDEAVVHKEFEKQHPKKPKAHEHDDDDKASHPKKPKAHEDDDEEDEEKARHPKKPPHKKD